MESSFGLIYMVIFFGAIWFFMIRPQQKRQKMRQEMLSDLKRGDRVLTIGQFFGEITAIRDNEITLRLGNNLDVKMAREGIGRVLGKEDE